MSIPRVAALWPRCRLVLLSHSLGAGSSDSPGEPPGTGGAGGTGTGGRGGRGGGGTGASVGRQRRGWQRRPGDGGSGWQRRGRGQAMAGSRRQRRGLRRHVGRGFGRRAAGSGGLAAARDAGPISQGGSGPRRGGTRPAQRLRRQQPADRRLEPERPFTFKLQKPHNLPAGGAVHVRSGDEHPYDVGQQQRRLARAAAQQHRPAHAETRWTDGIRDWARTCSMPTRGLPRARTDPASCRCSARPVRPPPSC